MNNNLRFAKKSNKMNLRDMYNVPRTLAINKHINKRHSTHPNCHSLALTQPLLTPTRATRGATWYYCCNAYCRAAVRRRALRPN